MLKAATRLERQGYPDALQLTPGQVFFRTRIGTEDERRDIETQAMAGRLAQTDQKTFNAAMSER